VEGRIDRFMGPRELVGGAGYTTKLQELEIPISRQYEGLAMSCKITAERLQDLLLVHFNSLKQMHLRCMHAHLHTCIAPPH